MRSTSEYVTTSGHPSDDPRAPHRSDGWRLVSAVVFDGRAYWYWERTVPVTRQPSDLDAAEWV